MQLIVSLFIAAPGRPKGPLKVSDVTKKGCKLKWQKPDDDGGKPIQAYVVEKLDAGSGRWVPVGRTKVSRTLNEKFMKKCNLI